MFYVTRRSKSNDLKDSGWSSAGEHIINFGIKTKQSYGSVHNSSLILKGVRPPNFIFGADFQLLFPIKLEILLLK